MRKEQDAKPLLGSRNSGKGEVPVVRTADTLPVPASGQADYYAPDAIPGGWFGIRITAKGRRTWCAGYRVIEDGRVRAVRYTVGQHPTLLWTEAKKLAAEAVRDALSGKGPHPQARKRAAREASTAPDVTFERVAEAWLGSPAFAQLRAATAREYRRVVKRLLVPAFGKMDPRSLPQEDVVALLFDVRDGTKDRTRRFTRNDATKDRKPAGVLANRVRAVLGSLFRWLRKDDQRKVYGVQTNPMDGLERIFEEPEPRPRVYSPDELRRVFGALPKVPELQHLVPLIAHTLVRGHEARGARWSEFDFERKLWTVPAERSKDRREHVVPLSEGAIKVLDVLKKRPVVDFRGFLFPAPTAAGYLSQPGDSIRDLRAASKVPDFNLHALRDLGAHWLVEELRVRGDVVEDLLSHTPPRLKRAYRDPRHSSIAEMREAVELWSTKLAEILARTPDAKEKHA